MIKLLENQDALYKLPVISSRKIKEGKRFHPDGLFSEQIFGPLKDYKCWCSTIRVKKGQRCPECGILIGKSSLRKKIFATIEVPQIISPQALLIIDNDLKLKKIFDAVLTRKGIRFIDNNYEIVTLDEYEIVDDPDIKVGLEAFEELILFLVTRDKEISDKLELLADMIANGTFYTDRILVLPPYYRPYTDDYMHELNKYYLTILTMTTTATTELKVSKELFRLEIQKVVRQLVQYVISKFGKKTGIFRQKISGKRIDLSGRAVIVPADIPYTHVEVPRLILLQLYKLEIAKEMVKRYNITFRDAFGQIDEMYELKQISDDIKEIIDQVTKDQFVLVNRQPTLHRGSILAFKIVPTDKLTIGLNHLIVDPLNADFDGDSYYGNVILNIENEIKNIHISDLEKYCI